jgi:drug/metabolite transporter (DMT)-like permease
MFITPLLASLMGFVLAGEKPDPATVAGGGMILAGMAVYYCGGKDQQKNIIKNDENCRKT